MVFTLQTIHDKAQAIVAQFTSSPDADSIIALASAVRDATESTTEDTTLEDQEDQILETFDVNAMSDCLSHKNIFQLAGDLITRKFSSTITVADDRSRKTLKIGNEIMARRIAVGKDDNERLEHYHRLELEHHRGFSSDEVQHQVHTGRTTSRSTPTRGVKGRDLASVARNIASTFSNPAQRFEGGLAKPLAFDIWEARFRTTVSFYEVTAAEQVSLLGDALDGPALRFYYNEIVPDTARAGGGAHPGSAGNPRLICRRM
jgi:hypothetical protein